MEASQENVTENLAAAAAAAAAAAKAAVESEVRGSDYEIQKGDMKEEHEGLVKGSVSETQKSDMKEEDGGLVEGSDNSSDVPVVDVTKNVLETEMVSVGENEEDEYMNDLKGGKEAVKEIDRSDVPVVETEVVSVEETQDVVEVVSVKEKEDVQNMDGLEGVKETEKGIDSTDGPAITKNIIETEVKLVEENEEVQDMDGLEGVNEDEKEIESGLGTENLGENGVQENGVHKGEEQEMNVNEEKSDSSDEEDVDERYHEFAVGDFVWGKIKSYPWWPGQIYDPSDASKYAEKRIVKGCFLVAYFGDDSFSWCRKSQLKRFAENFDEMSKQSKNSNFLHAVSDALEEFSRAVEVEIGCLSLPTENHVWDFKARNRGIKAGVIVPRGDSLKLFISRLEPEQLLRNLMHAAKTGSAGSPLEIRLLKSWLAGFYRRKGYALAKFHEPVPIEGLEDEMGNGVFISIQGPADEELTGIQASEDKVYQRKRKSVAEIMEDDMVGIELMHSRESIDKPRSKKMRKKDFENENGGGDISVKKSSGKRGRKRKVEMTTKSPESVQNGDLEKGEVDGKEETLKSFASRERKKSKYLSPPYTTPEGTTSKVGERMTKVAGQLIGSPSILTSSSNQSNKKRSKQVDDDIDVNEVMSVITDAAVDPMHTKGKKNLDQITGFVSAFRSSMYSDGPTNPSDLPNSLESDGAGGRKTKVKEGEVSLLITFPPSFTLPSEDDLFEIFEKFGEINETETGVFPNSFSAQIAFLRKSDAEEAYNECLKNSFFGEGNVNYRLLYPGRKASSAHKKTAKNESTGLGMITQKLEKLTWEVKSWDGEVTVEMKRKLEGKLKELVAEVSILPESSP